MDELDFSGRSVLVVGGSSGIGNGIAQAFRAHGAAVAVWGTKPSAEDYAAADGSDLTGIAYAQVDVTDLDRVEAAAADIAALDVLVLCQGIVVYKRGEFKRAGWDRVMAVNLDSLMTCARSLKVPLAADGGGAIIVVSSFTGLRASIGNPAYAASKAAAISLTKSLGAAWAPDRIRVNGIAPGFVDTKLTKVMTEHAERRASTVRAIPLGRLGSPADMAGVALFLASPLSAYVVGHTIMVDGGLTLS